MVQKQLTEGKLLDVYGNLNEAGYAKKLVKEYNRSDITANKFRIKEWDYYYIGNDNFGIALTIADNSYMGLGSVSLLDFVNKKYITKSKMSLFPMGKTKLPSSSKIGDVSFSTRNCKIYFDNDGFKRSLKVHFDKFHKSLPFDCEIDLYDEPEESMVIATPFDKKHYFYYNQKINCIRAKGKATLGGKVYTFTPEESFAVLDWGRGVWTYSNTWYWSSASGEIDGVKIGFNLGYGFGNTSAATENMIFYDGQAYKIEEVTFHIPQNEKGKDDFLKPWKFTSNDKTVNLVFEPILNRKDNTDILVLKSIQNQVFGRFTGTLIVHGKEIKIKDFLGFAEKVKNCW